MGCHLHKGKSKVFLKLQNDAWCVCTVCHLQGSTLTMVGEFSPDALLNSQSQSLNVRVKYLTKTLPSLYRSCDGLHQRRAAGEEWINGRTDGCVLFTGSAHCWRELGMTTELILIEGGSHGDQTVREWCALRPRAAFPSVLHSDCVLTPRTLMEKVWTKVSGSKRSRRGRKRSLWLRGAAHERTRARLASLLLLEGAGTHGHGHLHHVVGDQAAGEQACCDPAL